MTGDELYKYHWKAYEVIEWVHPKTNTMVQCAILMIDFECHTFKLVPVKDIGYEEKEFYSSITLCRKIKKNQKLSVSKK